MSLAVVSPAGSSDMKLLSIDIDASVNWLVSNEGKFKATCSTRKEWKSEIAGLRAFYVL